MNAPEKEGLIRLFKTRSYLTVLIGNTVSRFGDSIDTVAFGWMVYQLTGSTLIMGTLIAVSAIPNLLFSFIAGVVADRLPRKPLVVAGHAARGILVGLVALLFGTGRLEPWMLFVIGFLSSTAETFSSAAGGGLFQLIVPKDLYLQASSLSQSAASFAELIGLAAAGILIATIGVAGSIAVDAATFVFACFMTLSISVPGDVPEPREAHERGALAGFARDLKEGLRFVWNDRLIRITTLLAAFANFALSPFGALEPAYVKDTLGVGPEGMGYLGIGFTVGIMLGALALARYGRGKSRFALILGGFFAVGLFYACLGIPAVLPGSTLRLAVAIAAAGCLGFSLPPINATIGAYLMERTPPSFMGRANSVLSMMAMCAFPLGAASAGAAAEFTSVPVLFAVMGALILVVTLVVRFDRGVRAALREPAPDTASDAGPDALTGADQDADMTMHANRAVEAPLAEALVETVPNEA